MARPLEHNVYADEEYNIEDDSDEDIVLDYITNSSGDPNANTDMTIRGEPIPTISITQHISPASGKASLVLEDNLKELRSIQNAVKKMKDTNLQTLQLQLRFRNTKSSISKSCPSLVPDLENNHDYAESPSPPSSAHTSSENKDEVDSMRRSWNGARGKTEQKKQRSASLSSLDTDGEDSGAATTLPPAGDLVDGWCSRWHGKISAYSSGQTSPVAWMGPTGDRTFLELGAAGDDRSLGSAGNRASFLHKSISTPSILTVNDGVKVGAAETIRNVSTGPTSLARAVPSGESETEDESPLSAYLHHQRLHDPSFNDDESESTAGKRRKRGSIFFRKRKDKDKKKGSAHHFVSVSHSNSQIVVCDVCTKALNNKSALHCENCLVSVHDNCREQVADCGKFKIPKASNAGKPSLPPKLSSSMLSVTSSLSTSALVSNVSASQTPSLLRRTSMSNFNYSSTTVSKTDVTQSSKVISEEKDGESVSNVDENVSANILSINSASNESLPEVGGESNDMEIDPELGILDEESEAWINKVDKVVPQSLNQKDIKRQEHIYEFIMTEKHHCLTLMVMQRIFADGMQRELNYSKELVDRLFPRLEDLIEYHTAFLRRLRNRQREKEIVSTLEDILREQFSGTCGDQLRSLYGEFCSRHKEAVSLYKDIFKADRKFQAFVRTCSQNPMCKKKGIPECILFVTQRITKYPLLVDPLIKTSRDKPEENFKLQQVMQLIKDIIVDVNAQVAEKEREERLLDIYNKIDAKSATAYKGTKFKKSDLLSGNRKLMFEGVAVLSNARGKVQVSTVVVLSDVIFFLQENNQKFHFFVQDGKPGVITLEKLLVREKAGLDSRGIYLISSNPLEPEIYELQIQSPRDKKSWIDSIRSAIERCREQEEVNKLIAGSEEERKVQEARTVRIRQVVSALREKDIDLAVLLEEKMRLLTDLVEVANPNPLDDCSSPVQEPIKYTHLVGDNVDTHIARETLLTTLQEATRLASALYSTGSTSLSRSVSSAGERTSEVYQNPVLPRRAETFGGFDYPVKDGTSILPQVKARKKLSDITVPAISSVECSIANDCEDHSQIISGQMESTSISQADETKLAKPDWSGLGMPVLPPILNQTREQQLLGFHWANHVNALTCVLSQQITTLESLKAELISSGGASAIKSKTNHEQRLEELRNLQDKLTREKTDFIRERTQQEDLMAEQKKKLEALQEQLRIEQKDIREQREKLYQKLEALKSQGIIISPANNAIVATSTQQPSQQQEEPAVPSLPSPPGGESRRKSDAKRPSNLTKRDSTASNLPLNLLSATNQQKVSILSSSSLQKTQQAQNSSVKQQLPMKLATKLASSGPAPAPAAPTSPPVRDNSVQQMLPLRLSEEKKSPKTFKLSSGSFSPTSVPYTELVQQGHVRSGSSPIVTSTTKPSSNAYVRGQTLPRVADRVHSSPYSGPYQSDDDLNADNAEKIVFI